MPSQKDKCVTNTHLCCSAGGGSAGYQCSVPEIPSETQRHDDFPLQHAQG